MACTVEIFLDEAKVDRRDVSKCVCVCVFAWYQRERLWDKRVRDLERDMNGDGGLK